MQHFAVITNYKVSFFSYLSIVSYTCFTECWFTSKVFLKKKKIKLKEALNSTVLKLYSVWYQVLREGQ